MSELWLTADDDLRARTRGTIDGSLVQAASFSGGATGTGLSSVSV